MLEEYRAYLEDIHKCLGRAGVHLDLDFTGSIDSLYQSVDVLEQYLLYNKMLQISDSGYKISILDYDDQVLFTDLLKRSFKEEFRVRLEKEQERELETPPDPLASGGVVKPMSLNLSSNSDFEESEMDLSSDLIDEDVLSAEEAEEERNAALSASQQFMQQFNLVHRTDDEPKENVQSNSGIYIEDEPAVESNFVDFEEEMEEEESEEEDAAWADQSSEDSEGEGSEDDSPFVDFESDDDEDEDDWGEEESETGEAVELDEPDDDWEQEEEVSLEEYDSDEEDDDDWGDNSTSDEDSAVPDEEVFEEDDDDDWLSEDDENSGTSADEDDEDDWDNPETFENSSEESSSDSGSLNLVSADESVDDADVFVEDSDYDEFGYEDYSDEVEFGVSETDDADSFESSDEDFDDEEDWGSNTDSEDDDEFGADSDDSDDDDEFGADLEDSVENGDEEEFGVDSEDDDEDWGGEPEDTSDDEEDWSNDPISLESDLEDDAEDWDDFSVDSSTSSSDDEEDDEDWGADSEPSSEPDTIEDEDDYDYDAEEEDWGDPINSVNSLAPDPAGSDYFTFDKPIGGVEPPTPTQQSVPAQASEQVSGMQQDSFVSVSDTVQSMAEGIVGAVGKLFGRTSRHKDSQNNSK